MVMIFKAVKICVHEVDVRIQPEFPSTGQDGNHHFTGKLVRSVCNPFQRPSVHMGLVGVLAGGKSAPLKKFRSPQKLPECLGEIPSSASMSVASFMPQVCLRPSSCTFRAPSHIRESLSLFCRSRSNT